MPLFFNPAAGLVSGRIPVSAGAGRLTDNANLTLIGNELMFGNGSRGLRLNTVDQSSHLFGPAGEERILLFKKNVVADATHTEWAISHRQNDRDLWFYRYNGTAYWNAWKFRDSDQTISAYGKFFVGHEADQSNGAVQLATHTTAGGGIGFYDSSLYRVGSGRVGLTADLEVQSSALRFYVSGNAANARRSRITHLSDGSLAFDQLDDAETLKYRTRLDSAGNLLLQADAILRLGSSYVGGAPAAAGYLTVQDKNGNTYKLLCAP